MVLANHITNNFGQPVLPGNFKTFFNMAYQLGLSEQNSFFGLETLLAGAGLIIGVILLTALGYFSKYLLGRFFINLTEKVLDKVPFINAVYRSVKQIVDTFGRENRAVFKEVCLVEQMGSIAQTA